MENVTKKLVDAKRQRIVWGQNKALDLARAVASNLEKKIIDWDGSESEDWIAIRNEDGVVSDSDSAVFIHIDLPLVLMPKQMSEKIVQSVAKTCQIIEYNDFEARDFLADSGVLTSTFDSLRSLEDDGESPFSANSLYFHTV